MVVGTTGSYLCFHLLLASCSRSVEGVHLGLPIARHTTFPPAHAVWAQVQVSLQCPPALSQRARRRHILGTPPLAPLNARNIGRNLVPDVTNLGTIGSLLLFFLWLFSCFFCDAAFVPLPLLHRALLDSKTDPTHYPQ